MSDPMQAVEQAPNPGLMGMMAPQQPVGMMQGMAPQGMPQQMPLGPEPTFSIKVQKVPQGRARIEVFPPEEFRISRRARSIDEASYHGARFEEYLADVIRQHPEKKYQLETEAEEGTSIDTFGDERIAARFPDEFANGTSDSNVEIERKRIIILIEYVRGDFDRDGVVELRRVKRSGDVILENDIVQESEFSMWSPIPVSHRAIGISLADTLLDIQKIRTVLTRKAMDSLSQSLAPRTAISAQAVGQDPGLIDRLLDHEVGDVIPVNGDPSKVLFPLVTPDVSASAFQAIEYWDRRSEEASGVNRHAMGIQPQAITDTKGGIDALQAAANSRIEQYARWAALCLEQVLNKTLRILMRNQDQERIVKINGRRLKVDPRRWSDEMTANVHIGMAAESREKKLNYLNLIAAKQEQILMQAGPSNPLCGLRKYGHTLNQMVTVMGWRNGEAFFDEVPENWQPPAAGPDPKMAEMQSKQQLAQAELQHKQQLAEAEAQRRQVETQQQVQLQAAKLDADRQMQQAELANKTELAQVQSQIDAHLASVKAENERAIAQLKTQSESHIAQIRLMAETELARERMDREIELAQWETAQKLKLARQSRTGMVVKVGKKKKQQAATNGAPANVPMGGAEPDLGGVRFGGKVG